ncbi:carboxypeptidase-like regulatory domain-containing protein [Parafilimonas sp.]|uniref:carboxypeptidase-like regulatory domain-containing protein n=1 Tax=Parafilimonas sp. TaxID=1969739 RepID=UPI0039E2D242
MFSVFGIIGTATGTATNAQGRFTIKAPENATLVFSFIGYAQQELPAGSGAVIITTKRGKSKGIAIDVNSNTMAALGYIAIPKIQTSYGNCQLCMTLSIRNWLKLHHCCRLLIPAMI